MKAVGFAHDLPTANGCARRSMEASVGRPNSRRELVGFLDDASCTAPRRLRGA